MLTMDASAFEGDQLLAQLPTRIERSLREEYALDEGVGIRPIERIAREIQAPGPAAPWAEIFVRVISMSPSVGETVSAASPT